MFGCWAYYADDCLVWVSAAGRPPWRGMLVPTERQPRADPRLGSIARSAGRRGWQSGSGGVPMAGGRAFKSNVRERREAERRMRALEKRQKKEEKRRQAAEQAAPQPPPGTPR